MMNTQQSTQFHKHIVSSRVLGCYQITYASNGFIQDKQLVSKEDWDNILKPIKKAISIIEDDNKGKQNEQSRLLKESLKLMFGNYNICFPEGSPLHLSIKSGFLSLTEHQGGDHKVSWKRVS
jgi:hypothetical protein